MSHRMLGGTVSCASIVHCLCNSCQLFRNCNAPGENQPPAPHCLTYTATPSRRLLCAQREAAAREARAIALLLDGNSLKWTFGCHSGFNFVLLLHKRKPL